MRGIVDLLWNPGPLVLERSSRTLCVCKPYRLCSNRAATRVNLLKCQEMREGKESAHLQAFCKLQKSLANYRAAFTRQRTLVRSQHRPLSFP
jgi:hypothetical protein